MNEKTTFFMLYIDGRNAPTHKHKTIEEAKQEAQRLMAKTKESVYILKGIILLEPITNYVETDLTHDVNSDDTK